jgi:hypothetical protein
MVGSRATGYKANSSEHLIDLKYRAAVALVSPFPGHHLEASVSSLPSEVIIIRPPLSETPTAALQVARVKDEVSIVQKFVYGIGDQVHVLDLATSV